MPIHVQHIGAVLLGARADQEIRERHAVLATPGELARFALTIYHATLSH